MYLKDTARNEIRTKESYFGALLFRQFFVFFLLCIGRLFPRKWNRLFVVHFFLLRWTTFNWQISHQLLSWDAKRSKTNEYKWGHINHKIITGPLFQSCPAFPSCPGHVTAFVRGGVLYLVLLQGNPELFVQSTSSAWQLTNACMYILMCISFAMWQHPQQLKWPTWTTTTTTQSSSSWRVGGRAIAGADGQKTSPRHAIYN